MKVQQISAPAERMTKARHSPGAAAADVSFSELLNGAIQSEQTRESSPKSRPSQKPGQPERENPQAGAPEAKQSEPAASEAKPAEAKAPDAKTPDAEQAQSKPDGAKAPASEPAQAKTPETVQIELELPEVTPLQTEPAEAKPSGNDPAAAEHPENPKPPVSEEKVDDLAAAAMIAAQITVPPVPVPMTSEPVTDEAQGLSATVIQHPTAQPPAPVIQSDQAAPIQMAAPPVQEKADENPQTGSGTEDTTLVIPQSEPSKFSLAAHPAIIEPKAEAASQNRFDHLIAKASEQILQAKQPAAEEAPEQPAAQAPVPVNVQEAPVRRKAEVQEDATVTAEAAAASMETIPQPEVRHQPEQIRPPETPSPAWQLETRLMENLENQKMEFHMQLRPQELGKVNVKMVMEGGNLSVEIIAASDKAVQALRRESDGLMASLRMAGVQTQSITVVQETSAPDSHMENPLGMTMQNQPQGHTSGNQDHGARDSNRSGTAEDYQPGELTLTQAMPDRLLDTAV